MAAEEGAVIITYIFTGEEEMSMFGLYIIPRNATHLIIHESVTVIPEYAFGEHPNIVEVYCHAGVKRIEKFAFSGCRRLRRVTILGVEVVGEGAFEYCEVLMYVECPMLERIGINAFFGCKSLSYINLPSVQTVEEYAFISCGAMTEAKFGKSLESIGVEAFHNCHSLERITIPLKNGLITDDGIFKACIDLRRVDVVEEAILRDTVAALQLEEWRGDMKDEIDSINQILPHAPTGSWLNDSIVGGKAIAIREWITRVLRKVIHYKSQHHQLLNALAPILELALPNDVIMRNVLPFLELPSHSFEGEEEVEG